MSVYWLNFPNWALAVLLILVVLNQVLMMYRMHNLERGVTAVYAKLRDHAHD